MIFLKNLFKRTLPLGLVCAAGISTLMADLENPQGKPASSHEGQVAAHEGMNRFALDMYREVAKLDWSATKGNFVFSPYSLSMALGMCQQGAGGKTLEEMTKVLGLPADKGEAGRLYGDLLRNLENSTAVSYRTANAIWWDNKYAIVPEFQMKTESEWLARLKPADFSTGESCEKERLEINAWVLERTQQRIKDLLPKGCLIPGVTASTLVNAVHFLGKWETEFSAKNTQLSPFYLSSLRTAGLVGEAPQVKVSMMTESKMPARLSKVAGWTALELPFKGGELGFVALLEDEERSGAPSLDDASWPVLMSALNKKKEVDVQLPKFKLDTMLESTSTKEILSKLGMPSAFAGADFSAMCSSHPLFISQIFHKSFIEVKEEGAEAAAATAILMHDSGGRSQEAPTFHANRPFTFAIRHVKTGAILFMGRISNPS